MSVSLLFYPSAGLCLQIHPLAGKRSVRAWAEVHSLLPCFCCAGDAEIGSNNVNSLKSEDFHMRGLLDELNEDEVWDSSHALKACGKAVSIETASLSEYARYVLRTICQQVISKSTHLSSFGETKFYFEKCITYLGTKGMLKYFSI